jgi:hypothetical protein
VSYIKINGDNIHYNVSISPFTTQHGYNAIRFIGEDIPETDKGFKLYNDKDEVISDFSDYKYQYRSNEYSTEHDEIVYPKGSDTPLPPSAIDRVNSRISQVDSKVNAITPYEETKKAFYGEIEKVFYNVPEGNTTIFFDNYDGEYEVSRIENRLTIKFADRLKDMTNVTVVVNK